MRKLLFGLGAVFFSLAASAQYKTFDQFTADFVSSYHALHIPDLELSYVSGFQHIRSADSVQNSWISSDQYNRHYHLI